MIESPPWKEFEAVIERLQRAFHPDAAIERNARLVGANSKRPRQIDIAIRQKFGPSAILVIVECKHWTRKIDVKAVEAFAGVKEDVGAHAAMMISAKGFTRGARNSAERKQINLYTFRDTTKEKWPNGLKVPVALEAWILKPLAFHVKGASGETITFKSDSDFKLHDRRTLKETTLPQLCRTLWTAHEPKTEGEFFWEIACGERSTGQMPDKLVVGFRTKLRRTLRQGRFHFTGIVDESRAEAHAPGFRIEVIDAPKEVAHGQPMFTEKHAGFGLMMNTIIVDTAHRPTQALHTAILSGYLELTVESKHAIPISLAES